MTAESSPPESDKAQPTVPHGYAREAERSLTTFVQRMKRAQKQDQPLPFPPRSRDNYVWLARALRNAPRFCLPNGGRVLGNPTLSSQELRQLRSPAPTFVLEFRMEGKWGRVTGERIGAPKRIAVVHDLSRPGEALCPRHVAADFHTDKAGPGFLVFPLFEIPDSQGEIWTPTPNAAWIPIHQSQEEIDRLYKETLFISNPEKHSAMEAMIANHPLEVIRDNKITHLSIFLTLVEAFEEMAGIYDQEGRSAEEDPEGVSAATRDVVDEAHAALDFLVAYSMAGLKVVPPGKKKTGRSKYWTYRFAKI